MSFLKSYPLFLNAPCSCLSFALFNLFLNLKTTSKYQISFYILRRCIPFKDVFSFIFREVASVRPLEGLPSPLTKPVLGVSCTIIHGPVRVDTGSPVFGVFICVFLILKITS